MTQYCLQGLLNVRSEEGASSLHMLPSEFYNIDIWPGLHLEKEKEV